MLSTLNVTLYCNSTERVQYSQEFFVTNQRNLCVISLPLSCHPRNTLEKNRAHEGEHKHACRSFRFSHYFFSFSPQQQQQFISQLSVVTSRTLVNVTVNKVSLWYRVLTATILFRFLFFDLFDLALSINAPLLSSMSSFNFQTFKLYLYSTFPALK